MSWGLSDLLGQVGIRRSAGRPKPEDIAYTEVVRQTAAMVSDGTAKSLAGRHGLQILNITWEDTGRYKNSAVGPNISDMTIQVEHAARAGSGKELTCMPVVRFPNFSDMSADLRMGDFFVLVGNEKGQPLEKVALPELLGNLRQYLTKPSSWRGNRTSLLAPERDAHVLVSAQACFLPVPKSGFAEFNPVVFNYQSGPRNPAVLTILATREGTSITVIDNQRDRFSSGGTWGQRLFFNQNGERASMRAQRKSDFLEEARQAAQAGVGPDPNALDRDGLNLVLLIQVPLKHKANAFSGLTGAIPCCSIGSLDVGRVMRCRAASDVEEAVIGHGEVEGPFTEIDDLEIERDERFPIRVTVQFYKATSNGVVAQSDMEALAGQILKVYEHADYVGSLVVNGPTGRPTEHTGEQVEPPDWWPEFWARHFVNTSQTPEQAKAMLRNLLGKNWDRATLAEAETALGKDN